MTLVKVGVYCCRGGGHWSCMDEDDWSECGTKGPDVYIDCELEDMHMYPEWLRRAFIDAMGLTQVGAAREGSYLVTWWAANQRANHYLGMVNGSTFSSTTNRDRAGRFERHEAERMVALVNGGLGASTRARAVAE